MDKQKNSNIEFEKFLTRKKSSHKYSGEMIEMARNDFANDLTISQIDRYLQKRYDFRQMQILSLCIGLNYPEEFIKMISTDMDSEKMSKLIDLYDDGFGISQLQEILQSGDDLETEAKKLLDGYHSAKSQENDEPPFVARLMEGLDKLSILVNEQNEKLTLFDGKIEALADVVSNDMMFDVINQIEERDDQIRALNDKIGQMGEAGDTENLKLEITELEEIVDSQQKEIEKLRTSQPPKSEDISARPSSDNRCKFFPKKTNWFRMLMLRKNSKVDIVRLITDGGHSPEQIEQLKIAMEKGLTRQQLAAMINNDIPANKMKVIIEIAVLENKTRTGKEKNYV